MFEPTVQGDTRALQRGLNRLGTARMGPVSVGPGEGHVRAYTATGTTFQIFPNGASFAFRGGLTGLSPHLEANASKNEQQDGRLAGHDADVKRIDAKNVQQDGRLSSAEGRLDGHDSTLSSHNSRINTAQGRADSAYTRAGNAASAASTAQSRADSAYSRAGTGITNAATAKSRADAAYSLAAGRATQTQFDRLAGQIHTLERQVKLLEDWRKSLPQ